MTDIHGNDITPDFIPIFTHFKIYQALFCNTYLVSFLQPCHFVWTQVLVRFQRQFLHHLGRNEIICAPTVHYNLAFPALGLARGPEQSGSLSYVLHLFLGA